MYSGQDTHNRKSDFLCFCWWALLGWKCLGFDTSSAVWTTCCSLFYSLWEFYDLDNMCLTRQHLRHVDLLVILLWFYSCVYVFSLLLKCLVPVLKLACFKAVVSNSIHRGSRGSNGLSVGLVTRGCGFESRLRQELSTTEVKPLIKAPNHQLFPGRHSAGCPLLQVCVYLDGLNAENTFHCWLYSV